jgi:S1-C subfamily serine protease
MAPAGATGLAAAKPALGGHPARSADVHRPAEASRVRPSRLAADGGRGVALGLALGRGDLRCHCACPEGCACGDDRRQQVGVAQSDTIVRVVNLVKPSVVTITSSVSGATPNSSGTGVGSGFIVNANGLILTNNHVVAGASSLTVTLSDSREMSATVVTTDPAHDLALVKISATGLTAVTLGDSSNVQVGQMAIAIGSPLGTFTDSVTQGIVSGLNRSITVGDPVTGAQENLSGLIQTDAAINPGNSGGPLLDASGNVVGIITASASNAQDMGFAISINQAKSMISSAA